MLIVPPLSRLRHRFVTGVTSALAALGNPAALKIQVSFVVE